MSFQISLLSPFENYCESERMRGRGGGAGRGGILNSSSLLKKKVAE